MRALVVVAVHEGQWGAWGSQGWRQWVSRTEWWGGVAGMG